MSVRPISARGLGGGVDPGTMTRCVCLLLAAGGCRSLWRLSAVAVVCCVACTPADISSGLADGAPVDGGARHDGSARADGGPRCGNGRAEGKENCDGKDLRGKGCASIGKGFTSGKLVCLSNCSWDTTGCLGKVAKCGDGKLDPGEQCDNGKANSDTKTDACRTTCRKPRCGDKVRDKGEDCDDGNKFSYDGCANDCTGRKYPAALANQVCVGKGDPKTDKCKSCAGDKHCLRAILLGVANGSVIRVGPGTYKTIVQLFDKHNLIIEGAKGARIAPNSALEVFHVGGPLEGKKPCSNITIRGFEITSAKSGHGVWLEEAAGTRLVGNVVHLGSSGTNQSLVLGDEGSNNVIANNDIYFDSNSKKGKGIWLIGSANGHETGDKIYGNRISTVTNAIEVGKGCSATIGTNTFGSNVGQKVLCPGKCN